MTQSSCENTIQSDCQCVKIKLKIDIIHIVFLVSHTSLKGPCTKCSTLDLRGKHTQLRPQLLTTKLQKFLISPWKLTLAASVYGVFVSK